MERKRRGDGEDGGKGCHVRQQPQNPTPTLSLLSLFSFTVFSVAATISQ
jgi:hypothetical protein